MTTVTCWLRWADRSNWLTWTTLGSMSGSTLAAYTLATLQLGPRAERPGSPYADNAVAGPVADRIAELSDGNFLVAGLTARTYGLYDELAVDRAALSFTATVDAAMREYLHRLHPVAGVRAETLLTALAFAETPGIPADRWADRGPGAWEPGTSRWLTSPSLPGHQRQVFWCSRFSSDGQSVVFRLFHQALNDTLRHARSEVAAPASDERTLIPLSPRSAARPVGRVALFAALASPHAARAG